MIHFLMLSTFCHFLLNSSSITWIKCLVDMSSVDLDLVSYALQIQSSLVHIECWVISLFAWLLTSVHSTECTFFLVLWFVSLLNNT